MKRRSFFLALIAAILLLSVFSVQNAPAQGATRLTIDKRLVTAVLSAGEIAEFSITVTNVGTSAAHNVVVSDQLPHTNSVYVRSDPVATTNGVPVTNLTWPPVATLAPNARLSYRVQVRVNTSAPAGAVLSNTASVHADDATMVSDACQAPLAAPAIRIESNVVSSPVVAGQKVVFYATVNNLGPGATTGTFVSVRLDDRLLNPIAVKPAGGVFNNRTRTITWTVGNMAANGTEKFIVQAIVNPKVSSGFVMQANWTVTSSGMPNTTADQRIRVD